MFFLSPQNRNQAKWDIRVTQIPCDGSNLLQVNIIIAFEEWTYPFKLTCTTLQAPAGCGQYFTARSGNISSLNWKDGTYLKWISLHSLNTFHNLLIQGTPTLPPVSNRTSEPVPFNTTSKGKVTFLKTSKDCLTEYLLINTLFSPEWVSGSSPGTSLAMGSPVQTTLPSTGRKLVSNLATLWGSRTWHQWSSWLALSYCTGVCGSVVRPREMTLPSSSLPGFTFSSDDVHHEKQDIGYSISYRWI